MFNAKVGGIVKGKSFEENGVRCFKITNKVERYNDVLFITGKNTDINKLETEQPCGKGLHFSDAENILGHCGELDEPFYIREVTLEKDEDVYIANCGDYRARSIIISERKELFNIDTIKWMKDNGIDIHTRNDYFILSSVIHSNLEVVKYLVEEEGFDIHTYDDRALELANIYRKPDIANYIASII